MLQITKSVVCLKVKVMKGKLINFLLIQIDSPIK